MVLQPDITEAVAAKMLMEDYISRTEEPDSKFAKAITTLLAKFEGMLRVEELLGTSPSVDKGTGVVSAGIPVVDK